MMTITVELRKEGASARFTAKYLDTSWPVETSWLGNRAAFALRSGGLPTMLGSADRIEEVVAHQAKQSGATYEITREGTAKMRIDNVLG
jgi:hypothetical protein